MIRYNNTRVSFLSSKSCRTLKYHHIFRKALPINAALEILLHDKDVRGMHMHIMHVYKWASTILIFEGTCVSICIATFKI